MRLLSIEPGGYVDRIRRRVLGPPEKIPQRALTIGIGLLVAVAIGGAFLAAQANIQPGGGSSLSFLRPVLELTTSVWAYVIVLAFVLRRILIHRDTRYADQAADVTGYETRSVRRLAYEAKSADGSTRIIATDEDEPEDIETRILEALRGERDDDTISMNPEAFSEPEEGTVDEETGGELDTENEPGESTSWRGRLKAKLASAKPEIRGRGSKDSDENDTDAGDEWLEQYRLMRLDLQSTLDFNELLWFAGIPAAGTIVFLILLGQIWLPFWLYPPIVAAGLIVGIVNYARIGWKRTRRLTSLREEHDRLEFAELAVLVKEVEVPEARIQYAWFGDDEPRRYAHDDREEFAAEVAHRAYESVQGAPISPSVMELQAGQLERFYPDLHGFRDQEKARIMEWLVGAVEDSANGLVPKAKLVEDCVEYNIENRRLGSGRKGSGYDPALVREAYRELVPAALVEQEVRLDGDEGEETITAVRKRDDPLPPRYGRIRAQFSSQFANYARWEPLYELPDVDDRLEDEPTYANSIGFRGEPS